MTCISKIMSSRHSVNEFIETNATISEYKLSVIADVINKTSTSYNLQPFRVDVLEQDVLANAKQFIYGRQQEHAKVILVFSSLYAEGAYAPRVWEEHVADRVEVRQMPERYLDAATKNLSNEWSNNQAYIALQPTLNVCESLGLATCPIEGLNKDILQELLDEIHGKDANKNYQIAYVIAIGYADESVSTVKSRMNVVRYAKEPFASFEEC